MSYVAEYNERQLSFPEDTVNAMQGIFQVFAKSQRPLYQFMGVPILPPVAAFHGGTSYKSVPRNPEQCFLIGLSRYHLKPGERRPFFPSWSWAGWIGELSHDLLFSAHWVMELNDANIWIEENDQRLLSFPRSDFLPDFLSQARCNKIFIHIEAPTLNSSRCHVLRHSPTVREKRGFRTAEKGFYISFPTEEGEVFLAKFKADRELEDVGAIESGLLGKTWTGILLGELSGRPEDIVVLVVEEMDEHAERAGCFSFRGSRVKTKENRWDWLPSATFRKWLKETPKLRRKIRLG
jgi:hypothetical protein